jgi:hypothetical protein
MNQQAMLLAAMVKQFGQQVDDGRAYEVVISGKTLISLRDGDFEHSTTPINLDNSLTFRFRPHGPTIDGGKLEFIPEKEPLTKWVSPEGTEYEVGIDVAEDKCCRDPHCGGECTCPTCAPDLAARDLEAQKEESESLDS